MAEWSDTRAKTERLFDNKAFALLNICGIFIYRQMYSSRVT